jgi:hypothetical protein
VVTKGRAVGKSTELGSAGIRAWWEKQLGRVGLKESLMDLFKEELRSTKMHIGPTLAFSKLQLTPRSAEWLEEYHRRHPNPVELGKLLCETEPIMTDRHEECIELRTPGAEQQALYNEMTERSQAHREQLLTSIMGCMVGHHPCPACELSAERRKQFQRKSWVWMTKP